MGRTLAVVYGLVSYLVFFGHADTSSEEQVKLLN